MLWPEEMRHETSHKTLLTSGAINVRFIEISAFIALLYPFNYPTICTAYAAL